MVDIVGPADAVGAVTVRPVDDRTFGSLDSWFKDCTSLTAEDGTDFRASWFNGITALVRSLWRSNGKLADGVTPVVAEIGSADDAITRAVQYLIQRGQTTVANDTGTASHIVVSPTPAVLEYKKGLTLFVSVNHPNVAGGTFIAASGLGEKRVVRRDGSDLQAGDFIGRGEMSLLYYDGTVFEVLSQVFDRPTLTAARTYYVQQTGSDANDGLTTATPFATWQHAHNVIQKLNLNGWPVVVQGLGGIYAAGVDGSGAYFGGGSVTFQGSGDQIVVALGRCFSASYGCEFSVGGGLVLQSNDIANGAIVAQFNGLINVVGNFTLNACTGAHIAGIDGGQVRLRSSYTVSGGALGHLQASALGRVFVDTTAPITAAFGAGVNFSTAVVSCSNLGFMLLGSYHFTGSPTGARYSVISNGVIDTSGGGATFLPGNAAGSTDGFGVYR